MKFSELFESPEWGDVPFENKQGEISFLQRKREGITHQRAMICQKLNSLYEKGVLVSARSMAGPNSVIIPGTTGFQKNGVQYYGDGTNPIIAKLIKQMNTLLSLDTSMRQRIQDLTVKGYSFCFTGFRSPEMEAKIKRLGGEIKTIVSGRLDYLVVANSYDSSGKTMKAKELGTRVISKSEITDMLRD